jgi:tetratricopeptide (TPR) repeat protein
MDGAILLVAMPTRPRSHALEDESRRAFRALLPSEWVIRSHEPDYGTDEQVEVFSKAGDALGLMFLVQLKATDTRRLRLALRLSLKADTLDYYRSLELPVMIVRFHSPTKKFYWRWIHEFRERAKPGQKTITLHIPSSAEWSAKTTDEVAASLQMFRLLKSPSCPHPIVFSLVLPDAEVSGTPSPLLRTAIQDAAEALSGVLQLSDEAPFGAHPKITISNDMFIVDLAGLKSFIWHLKEPYPKALVTTKLPHDALTAVAFVLAKAGHFNEASEIASSHLDQATFVTSPEVFFELLGAMARSRRVPDALRLARKLLKSAAGPHLAQWLLIVVRARTGSLQDSELEYLQEVMQMFIERATELGDARLLGTAHYNLGNYLRGRGQPRSGFTQYRLATKSEPGYLQRPYFWKEIAGLLHLMGHFPWAASAYEKSFKIGGETFCIALRADSKMSSGRFREALKLFEEYMKLESKADDEWHLKNFMLSHLVDDLGLVEQKRDIAKAYKLADTTALGEQEGLARLREAIRLDALSSFAWFNLGATLGRAGLVQDAFEAYLFAGICFPHDIDAWTRALMHGLNGLQRNSLNAPLTICIARMAYRRNGQRFLEEVQKHFDKQDSRFPAAKLMGLVADAVKDIDRMNRLTEVRMVGQGANYEVMLRAKKVR